jgi:hypothetical protein
VRGLTAADQPQRLQCAFDEFRGLRRDRALRSDEARRLRGLGARIDREPQRAGKTELAGRRTHARLGLHGLPGRKHAFSSFQQALPPDCANRCSTGLKPPDIATRSHASDCSLPPVCPFDTTRRRPTIRAICPMPP